MTTRVMPAMMAGSPAPGLLVGRGEPVPVAPVVGRARLLGIGHEEGVPLGEIVHPRAGGEVGGVLLAAVEHDDEWHGVTGAAAPRWAAAGVWVVQADFVIMYPVNRATPDLV